MRQFFDNLTASPYTTAAWGILLGLVVKYLLDRGTERQRRQHERQALVRDEGRRYGIDFLTAADWMRRLSEATDMAGRTQENSLRRAEGAKNTPQEEEANAAYERYRREWEQRTQERMAVFKQAENACTALSLLLPSVAPTARNYLDLCIGAEAYRDPKKQEREQAQKDVEAAIRLAAGIGDTAT